LEAIGLRAHVTGQHGHSQIERVATACSGKYLDRELGSQSQGESQSAQNGIARRNWMTSPHGRRKYRSGTPRAPGTKWAGENSCGDWKSRRGTSGRRRALCRLDVEPGDGSSLTLLPDSGAARTILSNPPNASPNPANHTMCQPIEGGGIISNGLHELLGRTAAHVIQSCPLFCRFG
jgi:hypothetical protein